MASPWRPSGAATGALAADEHHVLRGDAFAVHVESGNRVVRGIGGQAGALEAEVVLLELDGLTRGVEANGLTLVRRPPTVRVSPGQKWACT